jgi:hypothetical protein
MLGVSSAMRQIVPLLPQEEVSGCQRYHPTSGWDSTYAGLLHGSSEKALSLVHIPSECWPLFAEIGSDELSKELRPAPLLTWLPVRNI